MAVEASRRARQGVDDVGDAEEYKWGAGGARVSQVAWVSGGKERRRQEVGEWEHVDDENEPLLLLSSHPRSHYIIPPDIARPLVLSSQLLLLQAIAALVVCARGVPHIAWGLPPLLLATYTTSVNLWKSPSTKNPWRYADCLMVAVSVLYGTLVTKLAMPAAFHALWCCGWAVVGAVFVGNETLFWRNTNKSRADYVLAVRVHLAAVHLGGNALVACALAVLAGVGPWL